MEQHLFELAKIAVEAQRQDDDILPLYWKFLQSQSDAETPVDEQDQAVLPETCRLLYEALNRQQDASQRDALIELFCQRRIGGGDVLRVIANTEFQAERYNNALQLYDRLLTLQALDAESYQHLKLACFKQQPFHEFTNLLLQRCLHDHPDDYGIQQFLFSQYLLHDKYRYTSFAPHIYHSILEREPDNLTARSVLCECYYRQGKYDQVIAEGEQALQEHPHHTEILATLAKAHYEQGEYGRTVSYSQTLLELNPGRIDIQVLLATVYAQNSLTTTDALKQYLTALKCEPDNLLIHRAVFRIYLRKLHVEEGVDECEKILTLLHRTEETDDRTRYNVIKEMIGEFERAVRRENGNVTLYLYTARLHEYIGHSNKALIYYRTMLQLPLDEETVQNMIALMENTTTFQMQDPHLYLYLGLLYHKSGRHDEAKLAFREAMYTELDEREVDDILVRHDRSIWKYPPVLVILAHHHIVTKDILRGLVQTFRQPDHEDWNGVLWVLQELYDVDDVLLELRQAFAWDTMNELYPHILPLVANNGSQYAIQLLEELLSHPTPAIRLASLQILIEMQQLRTEQSIAEASLHNTCTDVRLEIARYYEQQSTEQAAYHLTNMLHDAEPVIRLLVVHALQGREVPVEQLREMLFIEQNARVKAEIILLFSQQADLEESLYLVHLLNGLIEKRYADSSHNTMYSRLKNLVTTSEQSEEIHLLTTLIRVIGHLRLEQGVYSLATIAGHDVSKTLRIEAIEAIGRIGSSLGFPPLQQLVHHASDSKDIRDAAQKALEHLMALRQ